MLPPSRRAFQKNEGFLKNFTILLEESETYNTLICYELIL